MADIQQFKIIKELYTGEHLTVYQVEDTKNGEIVILRLMNQPAFREAWRELYRRYGINITNNKYLPALKQVDVLNDRTFAVLKGSEGNLLEKGQILTGTQIDQLLEAVVHLHHNNIPHGKISRFHIWIKENSDITLYGAGEKAVFNPDNKVTNQDDIKQVLAILKNHSKIEPSHFDGISFETIEELQEWVLGTLAIPKPGLVNKGESSRTVFSGPVKEQQDKEQPKEPAWEPVITASAPVVVQKNNAWKKWLTGAGVLLAIILIFIFMQSSKDDHQANGRNQEPAAAKQTTEKEEPKKNNKPTDVSQFADLFTGWELIKSEAIELGGAEYRLLAAAQKRGDASGVVKISVLTEANGSWTKVWESSEYESNLPEPTSYINSFLTLIQTDQQKALLVFDMPDNGSLGIAEITALLIQPGGSAEQVWTGPGFGIKSQNNVISVMDVGVKNLALTNGRFTLEEKARSEAAPADAKTLRFDVDPSGAVVPVDNKEISLKSGDSLAFIPANPEVKRKFDQGEILIYTDVYTSGKLSLANAFLLEHGNYVEFDSPGDYHFVLEYIGGPELNQVNPAPTFTANVKK